MNECKKCGWKPTEKVNYCEKCGTEFPKEKSWWEKGLKPRVII